MSNKSSAKKAAASKAGKPAAIGKPKRPGNAFCFFMSDTTRNKKGSGNMKELHEQWKNLSAGQKLPYERRAAAEADRYHRQMKKWESSRVKKPCNGYILFVQDFMAKNPGKFADVRQAVSAGAAQWTSMCDGEKERWKQLALSAANKSTTVSKTKSRETSKSVAKNVTVSKKTVAKKGTVTKARTKEVSVAKKKTVKNGTRKTTVAKKVTVAKGRPGAAKSKTTAAAKPKAKSTARKVAGTRKPPKTIKTIKKNKAK